VSCAQGSAYFKSENVAWTFAYAAPELLLNANCSAKVGSRSANFPHIRSRIGVITDAACCCECLLLTKCQGQEHGRTTLAVVSVQVDIYSFGVILWEIVTGEIPTRGRLTALMPGADCPKVRFASSSWVPSLQALAPTRL